MVFILVFPLNLFSRNPRMKRGAEAFLAKLERIQTNTRFSVFADANVPNLGRRMWKQQRVRNLGNDPCLFQTDYVDIPATLLAPDSRKRTPRDNQKLVDLYADFRSVCATQPLDYPLSPTPKS
jgi:hypothetical protein